MALLKSRRELMLRIKDGQGTEGFVLTDGADKALAEKLLAASLIERGTKPDSYLVTKMGHIQLGTHKEAKDDAAQATAPPPAKAKRRPKVHTTELPSPTESPFVKLMFAEREYVRAAEAVGRDSDDRFTVEEQQAKVRFQELLWSSRRELMALVRYGIPNEQA